MALHPEKFLALAALALASCGGEAGRSLELVDFGASTAPGLTLSVRLVGPEDTVDLAPSAFELRDGNRSTPPIRIRGAGPVRLTATLIAEGSDTVAQAGLRLPDAERRIAIALRPSGDRPFPCGTAVSTALVRAPADSLEQSTLFVCPLPASAGGSREPPP